MTHIAVLGLGAMGAGMARNLAEAGHPVVVWNRNPDRAADLAAAAGVERADTPREAAATAEVVISMVTDDAASSEVWLADGTGAIHGLGAATVAVESSTVSPPWVDELAAAFRAAGRRFVESPVLGSRPQLAARQLVHLVGASADDLDTVRPALEANGPTVVHVGPVGRAAVAKLSVNGLLAAQVALFGEVLGIMTRAGIEVAAATELLAGLPVTAPALGRVLTTAATADPPTNFPIGLVAKDLGYLVDLAASLDLDTPLASATRDTFAASVVDGRSGADISTVAGRLLT